MCSQRFDFKFSAPTLVVTAPATPIFTPDLLAQVAAAKAAKDARPMPRKYVDLDDYDSEEEHIPMRKICPIPRRTLPVSRPPPSKTTPDVVYSSPSPVSSTNPETPAASSPVNSQTLVVLESTAPVVACARPTFNFAPDPELDDAELDALIYGDCSDKLLETNEASPNTELSLRKVEEEQEDYPISTDNFNEWNGYNDECPWDEDELATELGLADNGSDSFDEIASDLDAELVAKNHIRGSSASVEDPSSKVQDEDSISQEQFCLPRKIRPLPRRIPIFHQFPSARPQSLSIPSIEPPSSICVPPVSTCIDKPAPEAADPNIGPSFGKEDKEEWGKGPIPSYSSTWDEEDQDAFAKELEMLLLADHGDSIDEFKRELDADLTIEDAIKEKAEPQPNHAFALLKDARYQGFPTFNLTPPTPVREPTHNALNALVDTYSASPTCPSLIPTPLPSSASFHTLASGNSGQAAARSSTQPPQEDYNPLAFLADVALVDHPVPFAEYVAPPTDFRTGLSEQIMTIDSILGVGEEEMMVPLQNGSSVNLEELDIDQHLMDMDDYFSKGAVLSVSDAPFALPSTVTKPSAESTSSSFSTSELGFHPFTPLALVESSASATHPSSSSAPSSLLALQVEYITTLIQQLSLDDLMEPQYLQDESPSRVDELRVEDMALCVKEVDEHWLQVEEMSPVEVELQSRSTGDTSILCSNAAGQFSSIPNDIENGMEVAMMEIAEKIVEEDMIAIDEEIRKLEEEVKALVIQEQAEISVQVLVAESEKPNLLEFVCPLPMNPHQSFCVEVLSDGSYWHYEVILYKTLYQPNHVARTVTALDRRDVPSDSVTMDSAISFLATSATPALTSFSAEEHIPAPMETQAVTILKRGLPEEDEEKEELLVIKKARFFVEEKEEGETAPVYVEEAIVAAEEKDEAIVEDRAVAMPNEKTVPDDNAVAKDKEVIAVGESDISSLRVSEVPVFKEAEAIVLVETEGNELIVKEAFVENIVNRKVIRKKTFTKVTKERPEDVFATKQKLRPQETKEVEKKAVPSIMYALPSTPPPAQQLPTPILARRHPYKFSAREEDLEELDIDKVNEKEVQQPDEHDDDDDDEKEDRDSDDSDSDNGGDDGDWDDWDDSEYKNASRVPQTATLPGHYSCSPFPCSPLSRRRLGKALNDARTPPTQSDQRPEGVHPRVVRTPSIVGQLESLEEESVISTGDDDVAWFMATLLAILVVGFCVL